jgi:hypothetical protein
MTPTAAHVAALLMREVVCEQVYRHRAAFDAEHPCRSLHIREITPEEIVDAVTVRVGHFGYVLALDKDGLKMLGAIVLDEIIARRLHR